MLSYAYCLCFCMHSCHISVVWYRKDSCTGVSSKHGTLPFAGVQIDRRRLVKGRKHLLCDVTITNDYVDPPRMFRARALIDTGHSGELSIPLRKAVQLRLSERGDVSVIGYGGTRTAAKEYRPVLVSLPMLDPITGEQKPAREAFLAPWADSALPIDQTASSSVDPMLHQFAGLRDVPAEGVVVLSPVTSPRPGQIADVIIGARGIEKLKLRLDLAHNLLFPTAVDETII